MAAIFALKDAVKNAKPILLEPVMKVENITPDEYQGDIMGDLNRRRGRIISVAGISVQVQPLYATLQGGGVAGLLGLSLGRGCAAGQLHAEVSILGGRDGAAVEDHLMRFRGKPD